MVHASGYSQIGLARKNPDENRWNNQLMHSAQSRRIALLREIRLRRELLSHQPDFKRDGIARKGQGLRPLVQKTLRAENHDFKL